MTHTRGRTIHTLLVTALAWALAGVPGLAGAADSVARHFDIPAQDMKSALNEFARQSDQQILFSTDTTASKRTAGVKGQLEPEAALKQLLKGTGLTFRVTSDRAILIENPNTSARTGKGSLRVGHRRMRVTFQWRRNRAPRQAGATLTPAGTGSK